MIAGMTNIDSHGVATALGLANSTIAAARTLVDLAKNTTNHELKNQVSDVLSNVLEMKIKILELDEANRNLKEKLNQKGSITRDPKFGYWFKDGETEPLCPKCFEGPSGAVTYLLPLYGRPGIIPHRKCVVCQQMYPERKS
jgi:hypothetical protein